MDLASVDVHDMRAGEQEAVRSLILAGLGRRLVADLGGDGAQVGHVARGCGDVRSLDGRGRVLKRCGFTPTHVESGAFGRDAWFEMKL